MNETEKFVTPGLLRGVREAYPDSPLQVAQALNTAAVEIERLNAELAVRDRALKTACAELELCTSDFGDLEQEYMQTARAELAREQEAADDTCL